MRYRLYDILLELAIAHVFKHALENFMYFQSWLVLNIIGPELSDVFHFEDGEPSVCRNVCICDIDTVDEQFLSLCGCSLLLLTFALSIKVIKI